MEWIPDDPAGKMALLTVAAAAVWKLWFRARADHRGDRLGAVDRDAHENIADNYDRLVQQLRAEVDRLARTVADLSQALADERAARQAAESVSDELQLRVTTLEHRLHNLGHSA